MPYSSVVNRAMAQVVASRPFKIATCVLSQGSPCGICGGGILTLDRFISKQCSFPLSESFRQCSTPTDLSVTDAI